MCTFQCSTAFALAGLCLVASASPPTKTPLETPDDPFTTPRDPLPFSIPNTSVGPRLATGSQVNVNAQGLNIVGDAANEPSLAVDPTNRNRLAIGWRQFNTIASNFRQAGNAYSTDGGRTWHMNAPIESGVFRSDPVLASSASGVFFYNSLTSNPNFNCSVFRSLDGGKTWGPGVPAAGGDKQWMTCDQTASTGSGHLYANWSFYASCCDETSFVRSTNGGASFNAPLNVVEAPYWGTLTTTSDGTLYTFGDSGINSYYVIVKSTNARNPAVTPTFTLAGTLPYATMGSIGFSAGPNPGGLLGQGWIDADRSGGPRDGWLYVAWSLDPPGTDPLDVMFSRSADGGATWSTPQRLNTDPPHANAWQWFGTMSVSPGGRIDVIWNDTRAHLTNNRLSEVFYTSSNDGGFTWTANQQLTPTWDSFLGWPNQNKIGDYYHMVSDRVGAFLAYSATFNGEQDLYCLRIGEYDCNGNGLPDSADITAGTSLDHDADGIPNECEETCPADYNGDGFVDGIDYDTFNNDFEAGSPAADFNGDGFVDGIDYDQFNNAFERGC